MDRRSFATGAALAAATAAVTAANAQPAPPRTLGGAITDVAGVKVGHFTHTGRPTGCTVIMTEEGAVAGVDVRGAAPGTRETNLLDPGNLVERVHAILLSGGSAFGLDAATGVMRWLEEKGIGYQAGPARVPIVPAAILFDLPMGDHRIRPNADSGYAACAAATANVPEEGSVGAGTGATVGKLFGLPRAMKGGIGTASAKVGNITVGAIVAVNAVGDVVDPATGQVVAGARTAPEARDYVGATDAILRGDLPASMRAGMATTIGVIATDAALTKAQCGRLATVAHDGYARAINPVHTMVDGDTVFCLSTGKANLPGNLMALHAIVPRVMESAILRAVRAAKAVRGEGVPTVPALGG